MALFHLAGLEKYRSSKDLIDYEGVTLDGNTLETVNPATGQALRVYDMDEWQVRAELEVRDIPITGNADDRAFRLQVRHSFEHTPKAVLTLLPVLSKQA